jgi:hypothetical protein
MQRTIDRLSNDPKASDVIDSLRRRLHGEEHRRRFFAIGFKDGSMRGVYPSTDDPLQFEEQILSTNEHGLQRLGKSGHADTVFPPRNEFKLEEQQVRGDE